MKRNTVISDIIKSPDECPSQVYLSNTIQVADILEYLIQWSGPAHISLSTFSISEEFLRRIYFIRKRHPILSLEVIIDFKASQKTLILWPFISQTIENCYLADNHSKILIIHNDHKQVAVVMSQNLTRGNRWEAGAIISGEQSVQSLLSQFNYVKSTKSVPFNEVFRSAIETD